MNKNNEFKIKINDEEKIVILKTGKYDITDIIEIISNELDIKVYTNIEDKVVIESKKEEDIITIISTPLSRDNLGFIDESEGKNKHIADNLWDLRIDNKVYLYLNNLSDDVPFGVLYFNSLTVNQFKFQNPYNLDRLEIVFKDSKGRNINFYNLPHSLSFLIEKIN